MQTNGRPRRRSPIPREEPTTITEICRRYAACAAGLARAFGLPLGEDFVTAHHAAIAACFIESSKVGLRLPERVTLPPLAPAEHSAPERTEASISVEIADEPAGNPAPQPELDRDPLPPGAGEGSGASTNGDAPLPTRVPSGDGWPLAGHEIATLKPAQLHLVLAKAGFRAHRDSTLMPLLAALQVERSRRMERGVRRNGHQPGVDLPSEVE